MKLRTAKKIVKAINTPRASNYTEKQFEIAFNRIDKTSRETNRFMYAMGDLARAWALVDSDPAESFRLFMESKIKFNPLEK